MAIRREALVDLFVEIGPWLISTTVAALVSVWLAPIAVGAPAFRDEPIWYLMVWSVALLALSVLSRCRRMLTWFNSNYQ
jgi:uncharacterized membrane protein